MEECLLGSSLRPEDTILHLHAAVHMANNDILQNICESITCRVNKHIKVGGGLFLLMN
jgi:hypothetical protein